MQEFSGDKLRQYIKSRGFSVSEFAEAISRHPGAVYGYMEGRRNPSLEIVTVMAGRLGVNVGDLFTDTELESAVSEFCRDIIRAGLDSLVTPGGREEALLLEEDGCPPVSLLASRVPNMSMRDAHEVVRAALKRLQESHPQLRPDIEKLYRSVCAPLDLVLKFHQKILDEGLHNLTTSHSLQESELLEEGWTPADLLVARVDDACSYEESVEVALRALLYLQESEGSPARKKLTDLIDCLQQRFQQDRQRQDAAGESR
ncbi:hypothetical protein GCM10009850_048050 [Nonomuraea monospora]|uniref:HTH cro/C1-type domain-containing protein n=1 Tax=Nonomuraea monospora TaxID=568818 RepID=A0ABN3CIV4_9ACTN